MWDDLGLNQQREPDPASPEPLLQECVRVTQSHGQRKKRDLLLFRDTLVITKTKRGSTPSPLLCLALGLLQVLSSGKGSAGDAAEEKEEGKATTSLVFLWLCGSCGMTLDASSLEKLLHRQAQDLLQKIPSKLLNVQLYEEWMRAMEKTGRQERLAALREVASKLPGANLLLLRHLLSLFSRISRNVATMKMTAGNLAICVAPNLLSPPQELPLDVLAQETGKVTQLLKFLINHHEELLGKHEARLVREGDEETSAPQAELETAEHGKVPRLFTRHQEAKSNLGRGQRQATVPEEEQN
ncbi:T-cell activation Rho GTPase-activating protein-like protein [Amazona aestiva]|uniref:T-cell activation Rho GTPase-activating protein-like protein n=1 Tax=Amazona aestiva TaxID=12930 RepID=A0A0Q3X943_AMAAE|nr:T-cell activation Rho GTPase-activating protein-like protein [Amazona aestiva]